MIKLNRLLTLVLTLLISLYSWGQARPNVNIYATGGTIAGSAEQNTDTLGYQAGSLTIATLVRAVPELADIANITGYQVVNTDSSNINGQILLQLSRQIKQDLASPQVQAAVVTHGTDTLEETAFFLELTQQSEKPIVVVGAMRPATAISADGPMNLLQAVALASAPQSLQRGVLISLNDRIASAFYTSKTHANSLDTFKATEQGYLGLMLGLEPKYYYQPQQVRNKPYFDITNITNLPKVDIVYAYQDNDGAILDLLVEQGAKGLVIAGNGNAGVSDSFREKLKQLSEAGIVIVRSSRTGGGYNKVSDGVGIGSGFLNPQKARILLTLALAQGDSPEQIAKYFDN